MSLEAKMIKQKLSYSKHIMRKQGLFGKENNARKDRRQQERGKPNTGWINLELTEYTQRVSNSTFALLHPKFSLP